MNSNLTLDKDLIKDLPNIEVFDGRKISYYQTESVQKGEIYFINTDNDEDEMYIDIKNLIPDIDIGVIVNFEDYFSDLQTCAVNQEVLDYQTQKRISSY